MKATVTTMSADLLIEKIRRTGNPTVVGLDPSLKNLPQHIKDECISLYGDTPRAAAEALYIFNKGLIDALCDIVPAVKPQSAYYELCGHEGIAALERTMEYARSCGMYVILDAKRGDIGTTAAAYADAHIGERKLLSGASAPAIADSMTVNPYLGSDGILPFIDCCRKYGKSIFVLAKTSNKSSGELQDKKTESGTIYASVAGMIASWGSELIGEDGYSDVGAVVGATYPAQLGELRQLFPSVFFLVPGYGAQGGAAEDVAPAFDAHGSGAIVNSSRGIIFAYQKTGDDGKNYAALARNAALDMRAALRAALT